jgi:hypothetical protein
MPAALSGAADRPPRRPRQLIPPGLPRRRELLAALATGALLGQLVLAPLTLLIAVAVWAAGRIGRWHASWLAIPAGLGAGWTLLAGPARAAAAYASLPGQLAGLLTGRAAGHPAALHQALTTAGHALPGQLPLALLAGPAEAGWLLWLDWLHRGGGDQPGRRPGLVALARRRYVTVAIRGGAVVTRDGCCVGADELTGRRASVSWQEAEGGVLCAGTDAADAAGLALGLVHAAIRRRKSVVIIDAAGGAALAGWAAGACAAARAPLACFGDPVAVAAPGCYEPVRWRPPGEAAELLLAMADTAGISAEQRASAAGYLRTALAVLAAVPGDPRLPLLDELIMMLQPARLRDRAARLPAQHPAGLPVPDWPVPDWPVLDWPADELPVLPGRLPPGPLAPGRPADRIEAHGAPGPSVSHPGGTADSAAGLALLAAQLSGLRGSALGQWLRPARPPASRPGVPARPGETAGPRTGERPVSIRAALLERGAVLFSLDQRAHRRSAGMIARLAAADFLCTLAEFDRLSARSDCLLWVSGCEVLGQQQAAALISRGSAAGAVVVLSTAQPAAVTGLADHARVLIASGPARTALAAASTGPDSGSAPGGGESTLVARVAGPTAFRPVNGLRRDGTAMRGARPEPAALLVRPPGGRLLAASWPAGPGGWR